MMNRLIPLARQHPTIKHGVLVTGVMPLAAGLYSLYHAAQTPFCIFNQRYEPMVNHDSVNRKYYNEKDLKNYENERPYFEYTV